ncbi:transposase zinc-binding domain-containing protein [Botrimarina mediterranea]|uniref:transposase zinc-binding domain-containing protein n=1 Tax=Botrimarina mediterranea TaxID=2528022 RepID=UPI0011A54B48|nr:transposase zinc-binding domain-containing protein [Botrimarina mediterranea]
MTERPRLDAAEVFRGDGSRFLDGYGKTLSHAQHRAFRAIVACRTKVLGGHVDRCGGCRKRLLLRFFCAHSRWRLQTSATQRSGRSIVGNGWRRRLARCSPKRVRATW